jgi:hypothetical protein
MQRAFIYGNADTSDAPIVDLESAMAHAQAPVVQPVAMCARIHGGDP